jgi:hypothetical protein
MGKSRLPLNAIPGRLGSFFPAPGQGLFRPAPPKDVVQRQPKEPDKTPPPKTLGQHGISANDPAASKTPALIDEVFARNKTFASYLSFRLGEQRPIAEKGKFIKHATKTLFEDAFKAYAPKSKGALPRGFYWETETKGKVVNTKDEIHLPPDATFGEAFHEAVHKMSSGNVVAFLSDDPDLAFELNEGFTSLYSRQILKDEGVNDYRDGYPFQREKAQKVIDEIGADAAADWYFGGSHKKLLAKLKIGDKVKDKSKEAIKRLKALL